MDEASQGYHANQDFNTVKLHTPSAPPAAPSPPFDRRPVRVTSPEPYMESDFDELPPMRLGPSMHVESRPLSGEFDMPPVRASPSSPERNKYIPPAMSPSAPVATSTNLPPLGGAVEKANGGGSTGLYGSWAEAWLLADLVLRVLTLMCAVIAVAVLPGFISKVDDLNGLLTYYYALSVSTATPKYEVAIAALGILYSAFGSIVASIRYFSGNLILGDATHLIFYIGDQVFVCLFLTAGSAGAAYLMALSCSDTSTCGNGSGGAAMLFIAFALSFGNLILSSISFYKRKT